MPETLRRRLLLKSPPNGEDLRLLDVITSLTSQSKRIVSSHGEALKTEPARAEPDRNTAPQVDTEIKEYASNLFTRTSFPTVRGGDRTLKLH
ncbi:hypothetical protein DY000_02058431 [Brassica cretica]|uniref:Uncharacterized protein n=1 Tax=Brassica cretica TaxID=69181 RepID=A0ABQ7B1X6_BRACR|nr:hypothetical protein DY000_02058431 [Brassica cretica]